MGVNSIRQQRIEQFGQIDIYPVISSEFCRNRPVLEILASCGRGGAKIAQLREKNLMPAELLLLALEARKICDYYQMLLIIDDDVETAVASGADGVHLGQEDMDVALAREIAPDLLIGLSTHNLTEALAAQKLADTGVGPDCINIGPVFATATKRVGYPPVGIEAMRQIASQISLPYSVMGGIKMRHIPELIAAGASRIAMVTEITEADDVAAQIAKLRKLMES